jgi:excisionase family DNA binding protein
MTELDNSIHIEDRLLTLKQASEYLGLPYFKLQRAAKAGLIPSYRLLNSRCYLRISDILRVMSVSSTTERGPHG